ncbi:MAG: transcriptional regulator GutM [Arachnia sp.]
MMFWILIISLGVAWALQSVLSLRQMQKFSTLFVEMRKRGKVCMGKFSGGIVQGAIVLFLLDDDGRITEGQRLHGVSVVARFKPFETYNGHYMGAVDPALVRDRGKSLGKAVDNARSNYQIVVGGGEAPQPQTALGRTLDTVSSKWRRKPAVIAD